MFVFAYSALLLLYFCLSSQESSLHRAAYTKSVKEWAEISCTSLQSSKSLFLKIQIFEFAYSSLSPLYFLFRFKNHHCIELYIRKVLMNGTEEISCTWLQSSKNLFRKIQIFECAYSALPLFYSLFGLSYGEKLDMLILDMLILDMFISVHAYSFRKLQ